MAIYRILLVGFALLISPTHGTRKDSNSQPAYGVVLSLDQSPTMPIGPSVKLVLKNTRAQTLEYLMSDPNSSFKFDVQFRALRSAGDGSVWQEIPQTPQSHVPKGTPSGMATVIADLSPGTSVIFKVDMASYCLMTKPGLYRITATLRLSNVREFDTLKKLPQPMHILDLTLTSNVLELKRSEQGLLDVEVGAGLSNK